MYVFLPFSYTEVQLHVPGLIKLLLSNSAILVHISMHVYLYTCVCARKCVCMYRRVVDGWIFLSLCLLSLSLSNHFPRCLQDKPLYPTPECVE